MTIKTERARALGFVLSEGEGNISRDVVTILSGAGVLAAGTILGQITAGAATAAAKSGGNTGDATISAVTLGAGAKVGVYQVRFTAATKFDVVDPDGFKLKSGTTGAAYSDDLGFTITAGSTPMVADDGFDITVAAGSKKFKPATAAGTDGAQNASAILAYPVDATLADVQAVVISRLAEVKAPLLVYGATLNDDTKKAAARAQLASKFIIAR